MANAIKYSESVVPLTLRKGDFYLLTGNEIFGTTSATGFWNGYDLTNVKYVIYLNRPSNGPSIYAPVDDNELIAITNKIANTNYSTASECIAWFATQSDKMVVNKTYPPIVTNGLVLNVDAGFLPSYPTSGTTWYNLSDTNNGTLINGPIWNSKGYIVFDSTDDYVSTSTNTNNIFSNNDTFSVSITIKPTETINANSGLVTNQKYQTEASPGGFGLVTYNPNIVGINLTKNDESGVLSYEKIAGITLTINSWQNITYTYDPVAGKVTGYKNGVQVSSSTSASYKWTPEARPTWIARNHQGGWGNFFSSEISNVSIYRKTLSTTEILQNYYQAPIVTDGLVLAVDASNLVSYESGSTTAYPLTSSVNGTLINGTSFNSNFGGYWAFDGVDDYITWGDNFDLTTTNISGFVWGWANSLNSFLPWIDKLGGNGNYRFHADGVGRLIFGIRNTANTYEQMITTNLITTNTWYYLGFTFNNSTKEGKIYLNGQLQLSNTFTINRGDTSTPLQTGYQANNLGTLNGRVATLSLYNKQLSDQEISQNFNAQRSRFGI